MSRTIRTFAVPIILAWIALIAVLNVTVPRKLEVVEADPGGIDEPRGRAVDDRDEAHRQGLPGQFRQFSAMIVLEGQEPLDEAARAVLRRDDRQV